VSVLPPMQAGPGSSSKSRLHTHETKEWNKLHRFLEAFGGEKPIYDSVNDNFLDRRREALEDHWDIISIFFQKQRRRAEDIRQHFPSLRRANHREIQSTAKDIRTNVNDNIPERSGKAWVDERCFRSWPTIRWRRKEKEWHCAKELEEILNEKVRNQAITNAALF
jgi:hypothetical protein